VRVREAYTESNVCNNTANAGGMGGCMACINRSVSESTNTGKGSEGAAILGCGLTQNSTQMIMLMIEIWELHKRFGRKPCSGTPSEVTVSVING
jgi:hypothetical protein